MVELSPFHLAIPVGDITQARAFYGGKLGFPEGRSADTWVDFDMFGHQLVVHLDTGCNSGPKIRNAVDGHQVPVPHFGVVLSFDEWCGLADRVREFIDEFVIEPHVRFAGEPGEQGTMFFLDPSGNALEFKGFKDVEKQLFAR